MTRRNKNKGKKLFEFVGYKKYAIVVAANTEIEARRSLEALDYRGSTWGNRADEVGFSMACDLDLTEVRALTDEQRRDNGLLAEVSHIIARPRNE